MNVNQSSVIRVLRAALLAFALFLIGYMLPHPGAMARAVLPLSGK
jgi:hypothetical protein